MFRQTSHQTPPPSEPEVVTPPGTVSRPVRGLAAGMGVVCFAFGLAMIANTHSAGDGGWHWYATLHRDGQRLYADMHLVLQPLAILEADWWMRIAGRGWIVSKVPAVLHLAAFVVGIVLVAARTGWSDVETAILVAFGFFVGVHFEAYRFDDYHVIVHVAYLAAILLAARLPGAGPAEALRIAALLGGVSGLAVTTRLNDGGALLVGVLLAVFWYGRPRWWSLGATGAAFAATVVCVVALTGDSFADYVRHSVLRAAAPKGGAERIALAPFLLLKNTGGFMWQPLVGWVVSLAAAWAAGWAMLVPTGRSPANPSPIARRSLPRDIARRFGGGGLALLAFLQLVPGMKGGDLIVILAAVVVLLAFVTAGVLAGRLLLEAAGRGRPVGFDALLVLLPFGLLLSNATSSAGWHFGLYFPVALFVLCVPRAFPGLFRDGRVRVALLSVCGLMALSSACWKFNNPFSWQNLRSRPMGVGRLTVTHPVYGTMIIDEDLHALSESVRERIDASGDRELLSLPLPYANYYCDIAPWHGFVQTFFDTTDHAMIGRLIDEVKECPPRWIVYQRQMNNLENHERVFNGGRPLPQRELDTVIGQRLRDGRWRVALESPFGGADGWFLIDTRPVHADATSVPDTPSRREPP